MVITNQQAASALHQHKGDEPEHLLLHVAEHDWPTCKVGCRFKSSSTKIAGVAVMRYKKDKERLQIDVTGNHSLTQPLPQHYIQSSVFGSFVATSYMKSKGW